MSINDIDIQTTLRDLGDLILTEPDLERRAYLYDAFLAAATDIGRDGFLGCIYRLRESGMPANQIAERHGVHHWTVARWTNEYAKRHSLRALGRQPRVLDAKRIEPQYKAGRRHVRGTPTPGR